MCRMWMMVAVLSSWMVPCPFVVALWRQDFWVSGSILWRELLEDRLLCCPCKGFAQTLLALMVIQGTRGVLPCILGSLAGIFAVQGGREALVGGASQVGLAQCSPSLRSYQGGTL